jgi:hypothetical protein
MNTIAQALNVDTFTLAAVEASVGLGSTGKPETKKSTPMLQRVPLNELELVYIKDSTVFNSINKIRQTIMSAHHTLKCRDKKVLAYFEAFTQNLGNSGSDITWDELLSRIFLHQCIYGRSWIENIYNTRGNRIVDWDMVDPKTMDYAKNTNQKIVMDRFGKPIGYIQTIPYSEAIIFPNQSKAPENVSLGTNDIFIEPKRIAQIKLYTVGDGFYGIGLIEPIYLNSIRKQNVEEALASAIWRHGFPIMWAQLGDLQHEPTPQQIQTMLEKLKDLTFKKEIATPYYYNLQILESKKATKLQEHLDYFQNQQVTGLGIPKPYATGIGEATNRATLNNMSDLFQLTLRDIITNTCDSIQKYMFRPVCQLEGFKEVPRIEWDMVGIDELDRKSKRILEYIKSGLLPADMKIQDYIKKVEDLE